VYFVIGYLEQASPPPKKKPAGEKSFFPHHNIRVIVELPLRLLANELEMINTPSPVYFYGQH